MVLVILVLWVEVRESVTVSGHHCSTWAAGRSKSNMRRRLGSPASRTAEAGRLLTLFFEVTRRISPRTVFLPPSLSPLSASRVNNVHELLYGIPEGNGDSTE